MTIRGGRMPALRRRKGADIYSLVMAWDGRLIGIELKYERIWSLDYISK